MSPSREGEGLIRGTATLKCLGTNDEGFSGGDGVAAGMEQLAPSCLWPGNGSVPDPLDARIRQEGARGALTGHGTPPRKAGKHASHLRLGLQTVAPPADLFGRLLAYPLRENPVGEGPLTALQASLYSLEAYQRKESHASAAAFGNNELRFICLDCYGLGRGSRRDPSEGSRALHRAPKPWVQGDSRLPQAERNEAPEAVTGIPFCTWKRRRNRSPALCFSRLARVSCSASKWCVWNPATMTIKSMQPGDVYYLPPDERVGGDPKKRRHPLLLPHDGSSSVTLFSYASTESTEASRGGPCVTVEPLFCYGCGFDVKTYLYPLRLVPTDVEDVQNRAGALSSTCWTSLQACLKESVGISTGTCNGFGDARGSWRGRLVKFAPSILEEVGVQFGVVLSHPGYSNTKRYQNVLPVIPCVRENDEGDLVSITPGNHDVWVEEADWFEALGIRDGGALILGSFPFSVWHKTEVVESGWTYAVDDGVMRAVDAALRQLFGI